MSISRVYKIVNDIDELVYIGSTKQILCRRMTEHRKLVLKGRERKLYNHMREVGIGHFKIMCVREYKDTSQERLKYKEDKYIKRFDTVRNGLNMSYAFGYKCEHNVRRDRCISCKGSSMCSHGRITRLCVKCTPYTCDRCNNTFGGKQGLIQHQKRCDALKSLID